MVKLTNLQTSIQKQQKDQNASVQNLADISKDIAHECPDGITEEDMNALQKATKTCHELHKQQQGLISSSQLLGNISLEVMTQLGKTPAKVTGPKIPKVYITPYIYYVTSE